MPKAKPYPGGAGGSDSGDEEEKTTIESQWEDEASTTVEQGEVAEKVRAIKSGTNVTHTSAGAMDEPTMDDQHAPVLSAITPLRSDQNARLAITQGNDTGQTFEIRPGKSFSVGRAIDNDIVLTDIAVSRRHFELRHEDGAWVIVDHRSGNGTVVNGNVEDNAFMLANGDTIEIGNTVFRFEQEKGPARPQRIEEDDGEEELSTVAGKPLRTNEIEEIEPAPTPVAPPRMQPRPKTLPPPMPLRSIGASQPPPLGMPPMAPQPASTLPLPQMANRPPMGPGSPTMLGDSMGLPMQGGPMHANSMSQPNMMGQPMGGPLPGMVPTTIPGQGAPQRPSYPYPQATEIPPHSVHAQMLLVQSQNRRGDASTAHVPPMTYDPMNPMFAQAPMAPQRYSQPQVTPRAKYIAAAAAIAVVAAIATIGIVKSGGSKPKPVASTSTGSAGKKSVTVDPIAPKAVAKTNSTTPTSPTTPTTPTMPKQDPPKQDPIKQDPKGTVVAQTPPKQDPPKQDPPKQDPPKQDPPKQDPPKQDPKNTVVAQTPPKQDPPKQDPPKQDPPKQDPPKQDPKKDKIASSSKRDKRVIAARNTKKDEPKNDPAPSGKTVAVADTGAAESKAEDLYKKRKFNDASTVLLNAAKSADSEKARDLRTTADYYVKLGKALNIASAPGMDAPKPYEALRRASTYDSNLGGFYKGEIDNALGPAAKSAAFQYVADKNWQAARTAVQTAEAHGSADSVSTVKKKLDTVARDLYNEAQSDNFQSQNSKDKLKQIMLIVDSSSTYYKKAASAIASTH